MKNSKGFTTDPFTGMRRPSSGRKTAKPGQKQITNEKPEEDKSGTFLTGIVHNTERVANLDERIRTELDIDVHEHDEFTSEDQKNYEMNLINAYEESLNKPARRKKYFDEDSSHQSDSSDHDVDFIKENTNNIGPDQHKNYLDRLNDRERKRLQELEDEIEHSFLANEETANKILALQNKSDNEKLELMSALIPVSEAGETGVIFGLKNAYLYDDPERIEKINDELKTRFLALPPADDESIHDDVKSTSNFQTSVFGGKNTSVKDFDMFSERSAQLTQISKRSGITSISHSLISKLSKPTSFPKEKILREKAEEKYLKSSLREIDDCLNKTRSAVHQEQITDQQMALLIKECQKENERVQMLEVNEEDEDDCDNDNGESKALVVFEPDNSKLNEAQELLKKIIVQKDCIEKGIPFPIEPGDEIEDDDEEVQAAIEAEREQLDHVEGDLRRRLQEQEDYLANIMKEIEEKEIMLKNAIEENNKYLDMEEGFDAKEGELSARSAAFKFSTARGNAYKLTNRIVNPDVPSERVIEELPEENDAEENERLEAMIEAAERFNNEYEFDKSHTASLIDDDKTRLFKDLSKATTDEERNQVLEDFKNQNTEYDSGDEYDYDESHQEVSEQQFRESNDDPED